MRPLGMGLLGLLLAAAPGWTVEYGRIDRTVGREPAYPSRSPQYALLLFGREARLRVWVVRDGEAVFLDRNGNGDLTEKGERFEKLADCKDIEIADPDGKTRYVITAIGEFKDGAPARAHLMVNVDVKGPLAYQQYCDVGLEESAGKAKIAHFHGPLTAGPRTINWKVPPQLALTMGEKSPDLYALIGTQSAEHGCWVVVRTHKKDTSAFPKGVFPVVDIEFPSKTPGGPAVKKRYSLDQFC